MGNANAKSSSTRSLPTSNNSIRLRWDGTGIPAPPGKPILVTGTDDSRTLVTLSWERSHYNGGAAITGYVVEQRTSGSTNWIKSSPSFCTYPELTLGNLQPGFRYLFRVRAQNFMGLSEPSEVSDPLAVTLIPLTATPPSFDSQLQDTLAYLDNRVEFILSVSGNPLPSVSWYKDDAPIFSSRRTRVYDENGKHILLIRQIVLSDDGEIKCVANNKAGQVTTTAKLTVKAPPRVRFAKQYNEGLLFEQNETIRLRVSFTGRPSPTLTWLHDGEPIKEDERQKLTTDCAKGESFLQIRSASRDDRGEYTVRATSPLGEDVVSCLVTITDRPAAPEKLVVDMSLGRSVSLSWQKPRDDGGCEIGTYIVEYYRIGWDVWLKGATSRYTKATLSELIEGSEYKFRVKAENPYGVSEPSEESDVIFVPDLRRGITSPPLRGKSHSSREISRFRGEKREVSFIEPTPRTRSLTREGKTSESDGFSERSSSVQRLASGRPSRADSRVTFAPETTVHGISSEPPIPPARTRDQSHLKLNRIEISRTSVETEILQIRQTPTSPERTMRITISPPETDTNEEPRIPVRHSRSRSRSISITREQSPSALEKSPDSGGSMGFVLKKQTSISSDSASYFDDKKTNVDRDSRSVPRDDDENELHGSSEFMLVLYPEGVDYPVQRNEEEKRLKEYDGKSTEEEMNDEDDLVPPPMSMSLPELFSPYHQPVEVMREAVSSTELLHERAMERFYKAVAVEKATNRSKRKSEVERVTGELATTTITESTEEKRRGSMDIKTEEILDRRLSFRRRSSGTSDVQSLLASWQMKKNRRRSSEGHQGKSSIKTLPSLQLDFHATSDPNLLPKIETTTDQPWEKDSVDKGVERLRRWHESNVVLSEETSGILSTTQVASPSSDVPIPQEVSKVKQVENENDFEESIESSEDSSELNSSTNEDIMMLKTRILARQEWEDEDTYHPRGRPIPHINTDPYESFNRVHQLDLSQPASPRPVSPISTSGQPPRSILKKRPEEPIPLNSFSRPIPPEIAIKPQPQYGSNLRKQSLNDMSNETMGVAAMSESDADSIFSAAEVARNRRIQAKRRSTSVESEDNEEDIEARMAMISHYTEIVREHTHPISTTRRSSISDRTRMQTHEDKEEPKETMNENVKKEETMKPEIDTSQQRLERLSRRSMERSRTPMTRGKINESQRDRSTSRTKSPASRSRNVSVERERTSQMQSSKTRRRTPSQERTSRQSTRSGIEDSRPVRDKSGERTTRRSAKSSSRPTSRSNSKDRYRSTTPSDSKIESLQRTLESKTYRPHRVSTVDPPSGTGQPKEDQLAADAMKNVRLTVGFLTDFCLLLAAIYVYLFKKETLAVPFIALLLYRRIQHELQRRFSRGKWFSRRKN
ncbi:muscle M-line assembly protein unc-89 isoform X2 [Prorops nasuta]|uniref:muscle M-line assembly protein unc-89 isoform X2 n=1 Tax=Prorops nasuta TaxID=863751 RepID=UPI0034CE5A48